MEDAKSTNRNEIKVSMLEGLARISKEGLSVNLTAAEKAKFAQAEEVGESVKKASFTLGGKITNQH